MRKPWRFYSLNRPKLRQSWNKYNLYNIARGAGREPQAKSRATFFQQKWAAKSKTRGYHGEHVSEKKWVRLFSRRLLSAVDLPPQYLAANDGSEQAAGRGSGLSTSNVTAESFSRVPPPSRKARLTPSHYSQRGPAFGDVNTMLAEQFEHMTPYMQMTFAPLERRLDTAVFRALFASSVRQARQFVIHGAVKVNGKKMVHPSYQLNPGDMFQVDVEKVLYGTGELKVGKSESQLKEIRQAMKKKDEARIERLRAQRAALSPTAKKTEKDVSESAKEEESEGSEETEASEVSGEKTWLGRRQAKQAQAERVKILLKTAKDVLKGGDLKTMSAAQKKELRLFRDTAQRFYRSRDRDQADSEDLTTQVVEQLHALSVNPSWNTAVSKISQRDTPPEGWKNPEKWLSAEQWQEKQEMVRQHVDEKGLKGLTDQTEIRMAKNYMAEKRRKEEKEQLTKEEMQTLKFLLRREKENPIDDSKPYVTPWRPKAYMSAFAFIPRYLEVNPNICAAVYLRHPVARKGMAEVPTPFNYLTNQLAHNWYLERG